MPFCPICATPLQTIPQREGVFFHCSTCQGRVLTIPQVRRVAGDHFSVVLLRLLKTASALSEHRCSFCGQPLRVLPCHDPPLELEGCRPCNLVWFDRQKFESVPEWTVENSNTIPALANEINALKRLRELKERQEAENKKARERESIRNALRTLWEGQ
jgi:hypothetical protein